LQGRFEGRSYTTKQRHTRAPSVLLADCSKIYRRMDLRYAPVHGLEWQSDLHDSESQKFKSCARYSIRGGVPDSLPCMLLCLAVALLFRRPRSTKFAEWSAQLMSMDNPRPTERHAWRNERTRTRVSCGTRDRAV